MHTFQPWHHTLRAQTWHGTCRCKQSLILQGVVECYYVFDKTSYRTGLNTLKNTAPYSGISLNFCALQLDDGPVKTSTICFDNSGIDPNHPYVVAKVTPMHPCPCMPTCLGGCMATIIQRAACCAVFVPHPSPLANQSMCVSHTSSH